MTGWIRERDTALTAKTPDTSSSRLTKAKVAKKTNPRRESRTSLMQTSLNNHFSLDRSRRAILPSTPQLRDRSSIVRSRVADGLEDHGGSPIVVCTEAQKRKRKEGQDRVESTNPSKKIKRARKGDTLPVEEEEAEEEESRLDRSTLFNPLSLFGPPPQSSLTQRVRPTTPAHNKGRKNGIVGVTPKPAISPQRKKILIKDSAWESAMQQHRSWERSSSSPLREIDNLVSYPDKSPEKIVVETVSKTSRSDNKMTPSKLRHGYSMLAFDEDAYRHIQSSDQGNNEGEDEDLYIVEDECPSPSAERQDRAALSLGLAYTRSPRSNKKVYAEETQQVLSSPLVRHQGTEEEKKRNLTSRLESTSEAGDAPKIDKLRYLDDSVPLSSPPPSHSEAISSSPPAEEEKMLSSSQTAPGGSFSMQKKADVHWAETYMSEEDEEGDIDELYRQGDETYKFPSSESLNTPIRVGEVKKALRSNSKTVCDKAVRCNVTEGDETQNLPWSPCDERRRERRVVNGEAAIKQMRVSQGWADVRREWSQVDLSEAKTSNSTERLQSSLLSFGFQSKPSEGEAKIAKKKEKDWENVRFTNEITFGSDEEVDSDIEGEDLGEETQAKPWDDDDDDDDDGGGGEEDDVSGGNQDIMQGDEVDEWERSMLLPSQGDLDTQSRRFLEFL